ncbi:uncharacterized protein F5147DRAFT_782425 [Suillus discolor]|uniref:Uncharacterized protein n=1 Tax=Suillus discolor TaxID=1912936 RepID=A0A9P7JL69_9AGAM|nr:uncharacterized protein F5147DRAFT_782425 [Suillus discolor]KAG2084605.1 hypothetical protein F5147DRAFT_782425 [Suillus discolor]
MVSTRLSNANKKVAQVVIDVQQKRRTSAQTHKSIAKVAAVQDKLAVQEENATAARKPQPRLVGKVAAAAEMAPPASQAKATALKRGIGTMQEALDGVDDSGEANMQKKRKRVQKTAHRDAVRAVHATAASGDLDLDHNDGITAALSSCASDADLKGNVAIDLKAYKATISVWARGITNPKTSSVLSLLPCQENPTSVSGISVPTQFTKVMTISSATAPPKTPENSDIGDNDAQIVGSLLDEDDGPERLAAHALMSLKKQPGSLRTEVIEVKDRSPTPPLPPPLQYQFRANKSLSLSVEGELLDASMDNDELYSEDAMFVDSVKASPIARSKWVTLQTNVDVFDDLDIPTTKRVKQETTFNASETKVTTREKKVANGEVLRMKYKNSDLPAGCQDGNAWRSSLIPTIAHAVGGDNIHPWLIEDDALIFILTKTWKVVYAGKPTLVNYSIVPGDAVYYVAKQRLSEWRGGFGSAAVMMIMSLMAASPLYESEDSRVGFANFWLEDNRFLFGDVDSDDKKEWSGMWQSTFVLQTFTARLNYTQGRVPVSELNSEESVLRTALSLSAAAVKHALNLLATKEMTFEIKSTSKGKKKPSHKGKVPAAEVEWIAVIGENESFSEPLWGYDTWMFLTAINRVPADKMKAIVELAQQYMKATTRAGQSKTDGMPEDVQSEEFNEQYADLLAFH